VRYHQLPHVLLLLLLLLLPGMLNLIAGALQAEGVPFVRVDGKSSAKARKDAIAAFAGALRQLQVGLCAYLD
jgi:hypothetical protein